MPQNNAYIPRHMSPRPVRAPGLRHALCVAGASALLLSAGASVALGDALPDVPEAPWDPNAPVIDGSDPDLPVEPDIPEDPVAPVDPEPEAPSDPVTPSNPDPVPGNDYNPSYDPGYTPSSGADAVGAGDGAFYDPEASAQSDAAAEQTAEQPTAAAPVFSNYDAPTGTLSGTAEAGSTVRLVDAWGNVLAEAVAGDDGWFWLAVPEGTDLATVSVVAVDEWGNQVGDALAGTSIVETIAKRERAAVRSEVEASTAQLAFDMQAALSMSGVASSIEQTDEAGMPVGPYVLGAASALLAVGVAGGAVALVKRSRRGPSDADVTESRATFSDEMGAVAAAAPIFAKPADDGLDDLERLALGLQGTRPSPDATGPLDADVAGVGDTSPDDDPTPPRGPGGGAPVAPDPSSTAAFVAVAASLFGAAPHDAGDSPASGPGTTDLRPGDTRSSSTLFRAGEDPESTVACPAVQPPVDPVEFAETARVIATGSGRVHRVTVSTSTVDLSGLDLFDEERTPQTPHAVADPMAEPDWYSIALAELASDSHAPSDARPAASTDDYTGLVRTKRHKAVEPVAPAAEYVAPVIGPSGVSAEDVERHRLMVEQSQTPQAAALRSRNESFRRQREEYATVDVQQPVESSSCRVTKDGVPIIARGAQAASTPGPCQRSRSVSDRLFVSPRRVAVPDFEQSFDDAPATPRAVVEPERVSASVAAAYAAAVYGDAAQRVREEPARRTLSCGDVPALGFEGDFERPAHEDLYATSPMSPAYINYMVQDEFAHRHDTPAQRNAALGRMRIVNGAATSPVSVRDGIAMHRYMA